MFGQAVNLAKEIVKFPQECLKVDRASAYNSTFRLISNNDDNNNNNNNDNDDNNDNIDNNN